MIDKTIVQKHLENYKKVFNARWKNEKFKWEAIKCFQDNWDIHAIDFSAMLKASLSKNVLEAAKYFPAGMIVIFAEAEPETVRSMFINLFDENKNLCERVDSFKKESEILLEKYGNGAKNHYQKESAICTYLWLKYPDKYYIYKYSDIKNVSELFESNYHFKKGDYDNNIVNYIKLYDEIRDIVKDDEELIEMFNDIITNDCYKDSQLNTLTFDFCFYVSRQEDNSSDEDSVQNQIKTNNDANVFTDYASLKSNSTQNIKWLNPIVEVLRELGGSASIHDVDDKLIEEYDITEEELAVKTATGATKVLNDVAWSRYFLVAEGILDKDSPRGTWTLSEIGEKIVISNRLAEMIIAKSNMINLAKRNNKPIPIIDLTQFYEYIQEEKETYPKYDKNDFLSEVYMTSEQYDTLVGLLRNKKNLILQGAPGVGKTFAADRLAYSMMKEKDSSRINFIQFHQNYSYEDFIMGYKPTENGFELKNGIFYKACIAAKNHPDKDYFFIIDEINRGNMSKIFGELLLLIENDKRDKSLTLAYSGTPFSVPSNLYIIGMMNTADRSLAMIDYALRRRFSFYSMEPGFDTDGFKAYQRSLDNETFDDLIVQIKLLNSQIEADGSLGKGFCIGHSYFCGRSKETCTEEWMHSVVNYDIIPMLEEYWFDDTQKVKQWSTNLNEVFNG